MKLFGKAGTIRVELDGGTWVELHKDKKQHRPYPDELAFIRATIAAIAASTNLLDANGEPVDVSNPETWKRFSREELIQIASPAALLVANRRHVTEVLNGR